MMRDENSIAFIVFFRDVGADLQETIDCISLASERFKNYRFELIIVDDGSKIESVYKITDLRYSKVQYVRHPVSLGISEAIKTGLNLSSSTWILAMPGHAMYGKLTFDNGAAEQTNFDTYRLIRMKDVPEIETHFVNNGIDPTGLGEPALPPTGGAVANAIFKATGKRLRNQPFIEDDIFKTV